MPAWPVRFEGRPPPVTPSPLLGQNNEEVLSDWLGLDKDAIGGLKKQWRDRVRGRLTMAELTGSEILAKCLKKEGIEDIFYIMGGPMLLAEATCDHGRHPHDRRPP